VYKIRIEKAVEKALQKINEPYYSKIKEAILSLGRDPRPNGYIKLKGREGYRVRVADYRIIYDIFDDILLIEVVELGHRKDITGKIKTPFPYSSPTLLKHPFLPCYLPAILQPIAG
jgi:mRNA interferase RelE/StbE